MKIYKHYSPAYSYGGDLLNSLNIFKLKFLKEF